MTHIFSNRSKILLFVLVSLFSLTACLTLPLGSTETITTPTSGTSAQGGPSEAGKANVVFGPGPFILFDTKVGLANLSAYKATLVYAFDGTRTGKTEQWSKTYTMLTTQSPPARELTIETAGNISNLDAVLMIEADGAAYERRGKNTCNAIVIDPANTLTTWLEPAGFLSGVIGAEKAGVETVNNIATNHYTFDERALGGVGIAKSTGEMWVATDGGYIVKYVLSTKGDANYFGEGIEGTLTWNYELTGANQPVAIQLPQDCPAGMVNAPQLPDASNVRSVPSLLTYDTSSSVADAVDFYQKQIPNLGWTLLGDPAITDTTALLDFTQGNQSMTVIVIAGDGNTKIHIMLGRSEGTVPSP
jgi:hypothetical protein